MSITTKSKTKPKSQPVESVQTVIEQGIADNIKIDQIDFSPLNYRKYFSAADLESFAAELKLHGIISPLTVRKMPSGRYELVAGERRLRAAKMAAISLVPVVIRNLSDEQVTEIQLAENLQRENPHPLDEAIAIQILKESGKTLEEIALRLGKSKQFVFTRLKLLNLVESFREMFFGEVLSIQQALDIASISQEGQTEFFQEHCLLWKEKNFQLDDLDWYLRRYKYDLKNAPFDTKDKKLIPEVGACTNCSFNAATLKSLFPELAKQAICTNAKCYSNKCFAGSFSKLLTAIQAHQPVALLFNGEPSEKLKALLKQLPEATELPCYDYSHVAVIEPPEEPQSEDYTDQYHDDEPVFDSEGYEAAMEEYKEEQAEYTQQIKAGKYQKGLFEQNLNFYPVLFSTDLSAQNNYGAKKQTLAVKDIQAAIKSGKATPEMLDGAVGSILQREERAKELDQDKIQLKVHKQFEERINDLEYNRELTKEDLIAARLLVYQSLDYSGRQRVNEMLFADLQKHEENANELFFERLVNLTDQHYSYLIRMAIVCKADSKLPRNLTGLVLFRVAGSSGIDVQGIQKEQEEKAAERGERMQGRIKELSKKKEKLKKNADQS